MSCGHPGGGTTSSDGGVTPSGGGGFTWNDMPIYPGAKQAGKAAGATPQEEDEWQRTEWRWYGTEDSQSKVVTFYQSAMLAKGWQQLT